MRGLVKKQDVFNVLIEEFNGNNQANMSIAGNLASKIQSLKTYECKSGNKSKREWYQTGYEDCKRKYDEIGSLNEIKKMADYFSDNHTTLISTGRLLLNYKCEKCGSHLRLEFDFCPKCGREIVG